MAMDIAKLEWAPWGICAATLAASWLLQPPGVVQAAAGVAVMVGVSWAGQRVLRRAAQSAADVLAVVDLQCQQQRTLIDSLPFPVWLKDAQGVNLVVNQAYVRQLHLPHPDAVEGKTDFALWPTLQAQRFREDDVLVMDSGRACHIEEQQGASPDAPWVDVFKTRVNHGPVQGGTVGVAINITERKVLEKLLTDSEEQFRGLAENITDLILRLDAHGRRVYMNPAMQGLYRGILGPHIDVLDDAVTLLSSDDRQRHYALVAQVLSTGQEGLLELSSPGPDGRPLFYTTSRYMPWRNAQGEVEGVIIVARDATARKQAEAHMQSLNRALTLTSATNLAVAKATVLQELLDAVCRLMVDIGGYLTVCIGRAESDARKTVTLVAGQGSLAEGMFHLSHSWDSAAPDFGAMGRSIAEGAPVLVADVQTDPRVLTSPGTARSLGVQLHAVLAAARHRAGLGGDLRLLHGHQQLLRGRGALAGRGGQQYRLRYSCAAGPGRHAGGRAGSVRIVSGAADRRRGQQSQERIFGHHEPRNPHLHERRAGHDRTVARHPAERRAACIR